MTQMNLSMKDKKNHGHREQTGGCRLGEMEWRILHPPSSWVEDGAGGWLGLADVSFHMWNGQINNKVLLYNTENHIQYPMMDHNGKEYEKNYCIHMYN